MIYDVREYSAPQPGALSQRGRLGRETIVNLTSQAQQKLAGRLAGVCAETRSGRVYIRLENIRGTHDATVLNAYISGRKSARGQPKLLAGTVGLYGLGTASIQNATGLGGLTLLLDVTTALIDLAAAGSLDAICVTIAPARAVRQAMPIIVGRISIVAD